MLISTYITNSHCLVFLRQFRILHYITILPRLFCHSRFLFLKFSSFNIFAFLFIVFWHAHSGVFVQTLHCALATSSSAGVNRWKLLWLIFVVERCCINYRQGARGRVRGRFKLMVSFALSAWIGTMSITFGTSSSLQSLADSRIKTLVSFSTNRLSLLIFRRAKFVLEIFNISNKIFLVTYIMIYCSFFMTGILFGSTTGRTIIWFFLSRIVGSVSCVINVRDGYCWRTSEITLIVSVLRPPD